MICPHCKSEMLVRFNRKTREPFWGCSKYPKCKGTVQADTSPANQTFKEYCISKWEPEYISGPQVRSLCRKLDISTDVSHWSNEDCKTLITTHGVSQKVQELRKEIYHSYLESSSWYEKRQAVLDRDNHTCRICKESNEQLQVHHLTYERIYNESLYDLITVCHQCHKMIHSLD